MSLQDAIARRFGIACARMKALADTSTWTNDDILDLLALEPGMTSDSFAERRLGLAQPDEAEEPSADLFVAQSRIYAQSNPDITEG